MIPEEERGRGSGYVYRDMNGKVYGLPLSGARDSWYEFYRGEGKKIGRHEQIEEKPIITSSQGLFHKEFPDGKQIQTCDLVERALKVEDPKTGKVKEFTFDYHSEGAHIMGLATAPNGTICGGSAFPMHFFSFDPAKDAWINRPCYSQWNTVATGSNAKDPVLGTTTRTINCPNGDSASCVVNRDCMSFSCQEGVCP